MISSDELQRHLFLNGIATSHRRADAEFADTDTNKDGKVTPAEYLASLLDDDDEETKKKKAEVEAGAFPSPLDYSSYIDVTRAALAYADVDHDGGLSKDEFWSFLNPEGARLPLLILLPCCLVCTCVLHAGAEAAAPPRPDALQRTTTST